MVRVGGHVYGTGEGRSKKEAEQQAAEAAWTAISARVGSAGDDVGPGVPEGGIGRASGLADAPQARDAAQRTHLA